MANLHSNPKIILALIFISLNIFLYFFINKFHNQVSFNKENYNHNARHFIEDKRIVNGDFKLLTALGQYDAQWYLKIAAEGYPKNPKIIDMNNKQFMDGLTYAFFPLYPLLIKILSTLTNSIELSAFILTQLLLVMNFFSGLYVINKLFSKKIALRTLFLVFLFPFSIFFRSYFTEGLQLFILLWFSYSFIKKRIYLTAIFLSFLSITKGNLILLIPIYLLFTWKELPYKFIHQKVIKMVPLVLIVLTPLVLWSFFNYQKTGDFFYFSKIQHAWFNGSFFLNPFHNITTVSNFLSLPLHSFHLSKIDSLTVILSAFLLFKSSKLLPAKLWFISLVIWLTPLIVKDTMSFTRFQTISFPLFIYLAYTLRGVYFYLTLAIFLTGLLITSLYFINWYWIG